MTIIAWWGAVLSTILALIKFYEMWVARFRVNVGYSFISRSDMGNKIIIRNLTDRPFILTDWKLVWRKGAWPFHKDTYISGPDEFFFDTRISPCSSHELSFTETEHFDTRYKEARGRRILIELRIAGRWRFMKKVYDAKKLA